VNERASGVRERKLECKKRGSHVLCCWVELVVAREVSMFQCVSEMKRDEKRDVAGRSVGVWEWVRKSRGMFPESGKPIPSTQRETLPIGRVVEMAIRCVYMRLLDAVVKEREGI